MTKDKIVLRKEITALKQEITTLKARPRRKPATS